ncbi:MAG: hypothetical protein RL654_3540 [Pseudomonadota bacterium]|jgi:tripartite-type tricarboxylate transporter receptor subunit TctC
MSKKPLSAVVDPRLARGLRRLGAAVLSLGIALPALAAYPEKPITLIVPFNTGTTPDIVSRLLADAMGRELGQTVVVINKVGASGLVGTQAVATAAPDGYTIAYANVATMAINQSLYKKLPYDADRQLVPIALTGSVQNVLVVRKELGVKSVAELVALARKQPGKLTVGSGGKGTTGHLSAEMLKTMAGIDLLHVPYKGGAEADLALVRGEVDMVFENITSIKPHLASGKLLPLAVTGVQRDRRMPELATMAELGFPRYHAVAWNGYVAPVGTDAARITVLNKAFNKVLGTPEIASRLETMAYEPTQSKPAALFELAVKERPVWAEVIRAAGLEND